MKAFTRRMTFAFHSNGGEVIKKTKSNFKSLDTEKNAIAAKRYHTVV